MQRNVATVRWLSGLVTAGRLLLLAAWGLQQQELQPLALALTLLLLLRGRWREPYGQLVLTAGPGLFSVLSSA